MGSTESQSDKPRLEKEYRLVRRFLSQFYAGAEITIVEHKQTREQFALKELVQHLPPQALLDKLHSRKSLTHPNLIQLRSYWLETDLNICSSLHKVNAIFEYHENSLEDCLLDSEGFSDLEVVDFLRQMLSVLTFLERNRIFYLLAGPKSIVVAMEEDVVVKGRVSNQFPTNRFSTNKLLLDSVEGHRSSLVDLNKLYLTRGARVSYCQLPSRMSDCLPERTVEGRKRRVYKLFEPLQGLSATKSVQNIQSYLQVPVHPLLAAAAQDHFLFSDSLIRVQNLFTITFIALVMCFNCDIFEIDIFKGGRLSMEKLKEKIHSLCDSHPRTVKELLRIISVRTSEGDLFGRPSQGLKIKDVSLVMKRTPLKENMDQQRDKTKSEFEDEKMSIRKKVSRKRISLLHN